MVTIEDDNDRNHAEPNEIGPKNDGNKYDMYYAIPANY